MTEIFPSWMCEATREYWMIYRGPGCLTVLWFCSSSTPSLPSPVSKLSPFLSLSMSRRSSLLTGEHCKDTIPQIGTYITRKEIAQPQSQFPHSCVCGRFIYSHDRSAYLLKEICGPILVRGKLLTDTWMWNWDWGRAIPFLEKHTWDFRYSEGRGEIIRRQKTWFSAQYSLEATLLTVQRASRIDGEGAWWIVKSAS